jgi:hypothetical protein
MQSNKQRLNLFSYKNQQTNHLLKDKLNHELLQKNPTNKNDIIITLLQLIETLCQHGSYCFTIDSNWWCFVSVCKQTIIITLCSLYLTLDASSNQSMFFTYHKFKINTRKSFFKSKNKSNYNNNLHYNNKPCNRCKKYMITITLWCWYYTNECNKTK